MKKSLLVLSFAAAAMFGSLTARHTHRPEPASQRGEEFHHQIFPGRENKEGRKG